MSRGPKSWLAQFVIFSSGILSPVGLGKCFHFSQIIYKKLHTVSIVVGLPMYDYICPGYCPS